MTAPAMRRVCCASAINEYHEPDCVNASQIDKKPRPSPHPESPRPTKESIRELVDDFHTACRDVAADTPTPFPAYDAALRARFTEARAALLSAIDTILADETMGVRMIAAERHRQVGVEGWTAEHDDKHNCQELALAAACYAWPAPRPIEVKNAWPWERRWWKPGSRQRDLARAGALIAAELDRLIRGAP